MRSAFFPFALLTALSLAACGPTLTRGPTGWHDSAFPFTVAPLDDGALVPKGWKLDAYTPKAQGFSRDEPDGVGGDLRLKRVQDDGALVVAHYELEDDDRAKLPEVFVERWLDRVVVNPKDDDESANFKDVIPKVETTATGAVGWRPVTATVRSGHTTQVDARQTFSVPGCDAAEMTVTIAPPGSPPDRRLYVAVVKPKAGKDYAVVVYGNTPTMFDGGLEDARSLAHRLRF